MFWEISLSWHCNVVHLDSGFNAHNSGSAYIVRTLWISIILNMVLWECANPFILNIIQWCCNACKLWCKPRVLAHSLTQYLVHDTRPSTMMSFFFMFTLLAGLCHAICIVSIIHFQFFQPTFHIYFMCVSWRLIAEISWSPTVRMCTFVRAFIFIDVFLLFISFHFIFLAHYSFFFMPATFIMTES